MRNVIQFTQTEWLKMPYTDHYSRGAWELNSRSYPEEWIGRRNTFEPNSTVLIAEGVSFEIIGENEWTEEQLRIPDGNATYEDDDSVLVDLETWFDVDKKFGTHTHDEPDTWVNLFAILNPSENLLAIKYYVIKGNSDEEFSYIPTTKERELVIRLIREAMKRDGI